MSPGRLGQIWLSRRIQAQYVFRSHPALRVWRVIITDHTAARTFKSLKDLGHFETFLVDLKEQRQCRSTDARHINAHTHTTHTHTHTYVHQGDCTKSVISSNDRDLALNNLGGPSLSFRQTFQIETESA